MEGNFAQLLDEAQQSLETWITRADDSPVDVLPDRVFEAGRAVGLTDKEIAQALIKRVQDQLRPGLSRP